MVFYQLIREQKVNATIDEVWEFISAPGNLKHITPAYMGFDIISDNHSEKMYPGMIISYHLKNQLHQIFDYRTDAVEKSMVDIFI